MEETNNFYCYFPGGHRRQRFLDGESSKRERKIIHDLDSLLEGSEFDTNLFLEEKRQWHESVRRVGELTRQGVTFEEIEKVGLESEQHCNRVQEMIYPFFLKMIEIGYTRNELTA